MMYEMIEWWSKNDSGIACDDLIDYPYIDESDEIVRAGATKMVFIPKEGDYVYKVSTKRCEYFEDACAQEAENYQSEPVGLPRSLRTGTTAGCQADGHPKGTGFL